MGTVVQRSLLSCAASSLDKSSVLQSEARTAAEEDKFLDLHLDGKAARSNCRTLGLLLGEDNLGRKMLTLSSAVLEGSYYLLGLLLCFVSCLCCSATAAVATARPVRPLLFVVRTRYDETPTKVRVDDPAAEVFELPVHVGEGASLDLPAGCRQPAADIVRSVNLLSKDTRGAAQAPMMPDTSTGQHSKVLQIELSVGCLLAQDISEHDDKPGFCFFASPAPTSLYAVEKTNASNIKAAVCDCLSAVPELQRVSDEFTLRVRHVCTDRAGANFAAERLIQPEYPNMVLVHTPCDVHKLYSCTKNGMSFNDNDVSGMLALALGTADPGAVTRMRQIIARVLIRRLRIVYDAPPQGEAKTYRQQLLQLVLPTENVEPARAKRNTKRRFVLQYFLNGPWWSDEVTHFCQFGCCPSPQATVRHMVRYVTWSLLPSAFPRFPRSRWTRYDEALDAVTLLAGCHNILQDLVLEFTGAPRVTPSAGSVQPDLPALENLEGAEAFPTAHENMDMESPDAQVKKQHRQNAGQWCQTGPYGRLVLMRDLVCPLMRLMYKFLQVGGDAWERKQQGQAATGHRRSYPIVEAAKLADVSDCMRRVSDLLRHAPPAIRPVDFSAGLQEQRFVASSSALSSLHCLLRVPRSGCPYSIFCLLDDVDGEAVAQRILDIPPCMRDELTHVLLQEFESWSQKESSAEAQAAGRFRVGVCACEDSVAERPTFPNKIFLMSGVYRV